MRNCVFFRSVLFTSLRVSRTRKNALDNLSESLRLQTVHSFLFGAGYSVSTQIRTGCVTVCEASRGKLETTRWWYVRCDYFSLLDAAHTASSPYQFIIFPIHLHTERMLYSRNTVFPFVSMTRVPSACVCVCECQSCAMSQCYVLPTANCDTTNRNVSNNISLLTTHT